MKDYKFTFFLVLFIIILLICNLIKYYHKEYFFMKIKSPKKHQGLSSVKLYKDTPGKYKYVYAHLL